MNSESIDVVNRIYLGYLDVGSEKTKVGHLAKIYSTLELDFSEGVQRILDLTVDYSTGTVKLENINLAVPGLALDKTAECSFDGSLLLPTVLLKYLRSNIENGKTNSKERFEYRKTAFDNAEKVFVSSGWSKSNFLPVVLRLAKQGNASLVNNALRDIDTEGKLGGRFEKKDFANLFNLLRDGFPSSVNTFVATDLSPNLVPLFKLQLNESELTQLLDIFLAKGYVRDVVTTINSQLLKQASKEKTVGYNLNSLRSRYCSYLRLADTHLYEFDCNGIKP